MVSGVGIILIITLCFLGLVLVSAAAAAIYFISKERRKQ
jgi:hypothetical protein